jgi:hypothetical protein
MSELIRRAVEKDLQGKTAVSNARQFFEEMTPMESFVGCDPEVYVRSLRSTSRILRNEQEDNV